MSEWKNYRLGEIADITSSKRIFYSEYVSNGVPFYRSKEIIDKSGKREVQTELFISEARFDEINKKFGVPKTNDILLTSVGTLGIPYLVGTGDRFYFKDGNLTWFRNIDNAKVDPKFLFIWLQSKIGKQKLDEVTIGSTQPALTISGLKTIKICLPEVNEQRAIAEVLSSLDDKIDLLHRQNKTLESLSETLFRHWFIDQANDDWEEKMLGNLFDIGIGRTPPRKEQHWFSTNPSDVKWISIKDMGNCGVYIDTTAEFLTTEAVEEFKVPVIPPNTVLLSFKMTLGRVAITTEKMLSNEAIAHFKQRGDSKLFPEFLYLFLKTFEFEQLGSTSSIVEAINSQMIREIKMPLPNNSLLTNFQQTVTSWFTKIRNNAKQIASLTEIRDSLLPKLMSGEVSIQ